MSAFTRSNSAEANSGVKLITLYNADLPANQSIQSFRVQSNTTIFDLINHLKKIYSNKEIQLFIQQNQLFQGNLYTYLFPILQQYNIRTIQFKVIGAPQIQNYQIEQQNQSQLSNKTNQHEMSIPEISRPSYSQANQQQILQLKEENAYLQQQLTSEKQQNLELQKQIALFKQQVLLQQSQRGYSEQIKQLRAQLEREKLENDVLKNEIENCKDQRNKDLIKPIASLQEQNFIITSLQQQIKQMKDENKNLNDECNQLKRNNQAQQIQIKDANFLQDENQKLMDQLVKQKELNNKEQVIQNINQAYEQQLTQLINQNSILTKQLTEAQQQIKRLQLNDQDYVKSQNDLQYEKQKYSELQKSQEQQYQSSINTINSLQKEIQQLQIKETSEYRQENNINIRINSNQSICSQNQQFPQKQHQYQLNNEEQTRFIKPFLIKSEKQEQQSNIDLKQNKQPILTSRSSERVRYSHAAISPSAQTSLNSSMSQNQQLYSCEQNKDRLSNIEEQSRILLILNCSHRIQKNELEQQLTSPVHSQSFASCRECSRPIGLGICRQLGQVGQTYLDHKCRQDLQSIKIKIQEKSNYYLQCGNRTCGFFCINTPNLQDKYGYCPLCLQVTIQISRNVYSRLLIFMDTYQARSTITYQKPTPNIDQQTNIRSVYEYQNPNVGVISQNKSIKIEEAIIPSYQNQISKNQINYQHKK